MNDTRFTIWHIFGLLIIALSVAALSLGGGVFLGYQWGRANALAATVAGRLTGAGQGETEVPGNGPASGLPFLEATQSAYLGVEFDMLTPDLARTEKLDLQDGALIRAVVTGSPADKAGLKIGDVIRSVNGTPVNTNAPLRSLVRRARPGDTMTLSVWRGGQTSDIVVTLGATPGVSDFSAPSGALPRGFHFRCRTGNCPGLAPLP